MFDIFSAVIIGISLAMGGLGPVNTEIIRRGIRYGFLSAFSVSLGATLVDFLYLAIIFTGVISFINIPMVYTLMWALGFIVLIYLGWQGIKDFSKDNIIIKEKISHKNSFIAGIVLGLSSPLALVWYLGIFGPMVAKVENTYIAVQVGLAIILGIVFGELLIAISAHFGRKVFTTRIIRYASGISGAILVSFGIYFGYQAILSLL